MFFLKWVPTRTELITFNCCPGADVDVNLVDVEKVRIEIAKVTVSIEFISNTSDI